MSGMMWAFPSSALIAAANKGLALIGTLGAGQWELPVDVAVFVARVAAGLNVTALIRCDDKIVDMNRTPSACVHPMYKSRRCLRIVRL